MQQDGAADKSVSHCASHKECNRCPGFSADQSGFLAMDGLCVTTPQVKTSQRKSSRLLVPAQATRRRAQGRWPARASVPVRSHPVLRQGRKRGSGKKKGLMTGLRTRTGARPFACSWEGCRQAFAQSNHLRMHWCTHTGEKPFVCAYEGCGQAFAQPGVLTRHKRRHSGEKPFACSREGCRLAFSRAENLRTHWRTHSGEKPFVCSYDGCCKAFTQAGILARHLRCHSGERPFVCPWEDCGYACGQSGGLATHVRIHSGEKPFVCLHEGCGYASTDLTNLTRHLRVHSGKKPFVCRYKGCGLSFRQSGTLQRHSSVHSEARSFVCPHEGCGQTFVQPGRLRVHVRMHSGKRFFACPHQGCGQAFTLPGDLTRHLRIHTGEKPFVCPHESCGRSFAQSGSLARHACVHTGEKSFVCLHEGCGRSFTQSASLTRHSRVHGEEKTFVGWHESGGYAFIQPVKRHNHGRSHTQAEPFVCGRASGMNLSGKSGALRGYPLRRTDLSASRQRRLSRLCSDSARPATPAAPGVERARSTMPSDRARQPSPGRHLLSSSVAQAVPSGWGQPGLSREAAVPAWLRKCAADYFTKLLPSMYSTWMLDREDYSSAPTDDDWWDFWREFISPAESEIWPSTCWVHCCFGILPVLQGGEDVNLCRIQRRAPGSAGALRPDGMADRPVGRRAVHKSVTAVQISPLFTQAFEGHAPRYKVTWQTGIFWRARGDWSASCYRLRKMFSLSEQGVRAKVQLQICSGKTPACPHRKKALYLPLWRLRICICSIGQSENPLERPLRRKTLRLSLWRL